MSSLIDKTSNESCSHDEKEPDFLNYIVVSEGGHCKSVIGNLFLCFTQR